VGFEFFISVEIGWLSWEKSLWHCWWEGWGWLTWWAEGLQRAQHCEAAWVATSSHLLLLASFNILTYAAEETKRR